MLDLVQQVRDRLDEWTHPSGEAPPAFTEPADIDPELAAVIQAAWDMLLKADPGPHRIVVLPPSPFDLMRKAILAVVDYAQPGDAFPGEGGSRDHAEKAIDAEVEAVRARVLELIAEKLGIEVGDE